MIRCALLPCFLVVLSCALSAAEKAEAPARALAFQTGKVTVGANIATIDLPEGCRYLQAQDARYMMEQVYGNPPNPDTLGLVMPAESEDEKAANWVAEVSYSESEGHVKDDDAKTIKYDDLLKQMQQEARDSAPELKKQGYPTCQLLGWAEPPHYDASTHKLYWAKSLQFDDSPKPTINYDVRLLGRKGVLQITTIAPLTELAMVSDASKAVLAKTEISTGNRYEDFKPGIDKVAAYGIGGLIAGGLLLKSGFFAIIGKFILLAIKPILIGLAVVGGGIAKLFSKKKKAQDQA